LSDVSDLTTPIRLVSTVSVAPALVAEAVARARAMLAVAPAVMTAEVGVRRQVGTGDVVPGDYVISATFTDHAALLRYAGSEEHDAVHDWVVEHLVAEHVSVFEAARVAREADGADDGHR
jgi:hypothetical protein